MELVVEVHVADSLPLQSHLGTFNGSLYSVPFLDSGLVLLLGHASSQLLVFLPLVVKLDGAAFLTPAHACVSSSRLAHPLLLLFLLLVLLFLNNLLALEENFGWNCHSNFVINF